MKRDCSACKTGVCSAHKPDPFSEKGYGDAGPLPFRKSPEIGRNEKCPCGSGLKYKRCHLIMGLADPFQGPEMSEELKLKRRRAAKTLLLMTSAIVK